MTENCLRNNATHCNGNGSVKVDNKFEEIEIPVPWGHISAKWWGPKTVQPIIAMHGWQDNSGTFDNLAPLLVERNLALLCIDMPGHGFSSHLPSGTYYYLWWDGVQYLRRIVKYFKWESISILGHSMGGALAFLYAAVYPDEVAKMISIDIASPAVRHPKKMISIIGHSVDKFLSYEHLTLDKLPCYDYEEMVNIVEEAHAGSVNRKGCEILLRRGMKPADHKEGYIFTRDPRLKVAAMGQIGIDQVLIMAERIKCEVLNIRANPGMKHDNPEYYDLVLDTLEKNAKKVERHLVEGTHHLHLNDAPSVATIIGNFLTS